MKKILIMATIFSIILNLLGCKQQEEYKTAEIYNDLRNLAFNADLKKLNVPTKEGRKTYGVIMETGYPEAVATLVAMGDGSVSLYFSNGGGIIGVGEHESARKISLEYIKEADNYLKYAAKTNAYPLPKQKQTIFYFLTYEGVFTYGALESDLGENHSELSKLFYNAQDLISEARLIDESRNKNKSKLE